jgi:hypothetical protein
MEVGLVRYQSGPVKYNPSRKAELGSIEKLRKRNERSQNYGASGAGSFLP